MAAPLVHILESDYAKHFETCLHELAREIAFSGLSLSEIAKGTRLKWDTVYAASQGRAVRMDNYDRIRFYVGECRRMAETAAKEECSTLNVPGEKASVR